MAIQSATVSTSPKVMKSSACTAAVKFEKVGIYPSTVGLDGWVTVTVAVVVSVVVIVVVLITVVVDVSVTVFVGWG
jgi:hypothetical protein